jgi:multiple RNA-binding domain-containing protein 1
MDMSSCRGGKRRSGLGDERAFLSKTRVCIKNLPPKTTEQDLKEYLMSRSINNNMDETLHITDCKILKNQKGGSRKVAFVGFRSADHAIFAIQTFHRAFLNMTRITVEPAITRKELAENEHTNSPSSNTNDEETERGKASLGNIDRKVDDKKLQKFLRGVDTITSKPKFWSNDDDDVVVDASAAAKRSKSNALRDNHSSDDSDTRSNDDSFGVTDPGENSNKIQSVTKNHNTSSDMEFLWSKQKQVDDLEKDTVNLADSLLGSSSSSTNDRDSDIEGDQDILKALKAAESLIEETSQPFPFGNQAFRSKPPL